MLKTCGHLWLHFTPSRCLLLILLITSVEYFNWTLLVPLCRAKVQSRVFIKLPIIYGELFPEYKEYCGKLLHLLKSAYGITYSGKYWLQELYKWLVEEGFVQSRTIPCYFYKRYVDGSKVKLLVYVDDML